MSVSSPGPDSTGGLGSSRRLFKNDDARAQLGSTPYSWFAWALSKIVTPSPQELGIKTEKYSFFRNLFGLQMTIQVKDETIYLNKKSAEKYLESNRVKIFETLKSKTKETNSLNENAITIQDLAKYYLYSNKASNPSSAKDSDMGSQRNSTSSSSGTKRTVSFPGESSLAEAQTPSRLSSASTPSPRTSVGSSMSLPSSSSASRSLAQQAQSPILEKTEWMKEIDAHLNQETKEQLLLLPIEARKIIYRAIQLKEQRNSKANHPLVIDYNKKVLEAKRFFDQENTSEQNSLKSLVDPEKAAKHLDDLTYSWMERNEKRIDSKLDTENTEAKQRLESLPPREKEIIYRVIAIKEQGKGRANVDYLKTVVNARRLLHTLKPMLQNRNLEDAAKLLDEEITKSYQAPQKTPPPQESPKSKAKLDLESEVGKLKISDSKREKAVLSNTETLLRAGMPESYCYNVLPVLAQMDPIPMGRVCETAKALVGKAQDGGDFSTFLNALFLMKDENDTVRNEGAWHLRTPLCQVTAVLVGTEKTDSSSKMTLTEGFDRVRKLPEEKLEFLVGKDRSSILTALRAPKHKKH